MVARRWSDRTCPKRGTPGVRFVRSAAAATPLEGQNGVPRPAGHSVNASLSFWHVNFRRAELAGPYSPRRRPAQTARTSWTLHPCTDVRSAALSAQLSSRIRAASGADAKSWPFSLRERLRDEATPVCWSPLDSLLNAKHRVLSAFQVPAYAAVHRSHVIENTGPTSSNDTVAPASPCQADDEDGARALQMLSAAAWLRTSPSSSEGAYQTEPHGRTYSQRGFKSRVRCIVIVLDSMCR